MPRFKIIQERDATIRFEVEVEAASPEPALELAATCSCAWTETGHFAHDSADMSVVDATGAILLPARKVW
jgi:hypothetical protein